LNDDEQDQAVVRNRLRTATLSDDPADPQQCEGSEPSDDGWKLRGGDQARERGIADRAGAGVREAGGDGDEAKYTDCLRVLEIRENRIDHRGYQDTRGTENCCSQASVHSSILQQRENETRVPWIGDPEKLKTISEPTASLRFPFESTRPQICPPHSVFLVGPEREMPERGSQEKPFRITGPRAERSSSAYPTDSRITRVGKRTEMQD
jgi:hypothetical protein